MLVSDLGGGKTTFTKGLAAGLGIGATVHSPTYTLHRSYLIDNRDNIISLDHFDLYRTSEDDTIVWVIKELLEQNNSLIVIEWPGINIKSLLSDYLEVNINIEGENRLFNFRSHGPNANELLLRLKNK